MSSDQTPELIRKLGANMSVEEHRKAIDRIEQICKAYVEDLQDGAAATLNISYVAKGASRDPKTRVPRGLHVLTAEGPEIVPHLLAELRRQQNDPFRGMTLEQIEAFLGRWAEDQLEQPEADLPVVRQERLVRMVTRLIDRVLGKSTIH